jgi:hypothetical protein
MFLPMWVTREKAEWMWGERQVDVSVHVGYQEKAEWKWGERQVDISAHVGYQRQSRVEVGRETGRCLCPCGLPETKQNGNGERDR